MSFILLVGGSGFIGTNLAHHFLDNGESVIVYDRNVPDITHDRLVFIKGEISDLNKPSVFNDLSSYEIKDALFLINNVPVNNNVGDLGSKLNIVKDAILFLYKLVDRIIFFSSGGRVYGSGKSVHKEIDSLDPLCSYGKSKVLLEGYLSELVLNYSGSKSYLVLRPSNPYGSYQRGNNGQGVIPIFVGKILSGDPLTIYGNGKETRDYIYIKDLVTLTYLLMKKKSLKYNVYNIGTGVGESLNDIVSYLKMYMKGKKFNLVYLKQGVASQIPSNVLCVSRLLEEVGEYSFVNLKEGLSFYLSCLDEK